MHLLLMVIGAYAVVAVVLLIVLCLAAADRASRPADVIYARHVAPPAPLSTAPAHEPLHLGNAAAD